MERVKFYATCNIAQLHEELIKRDLSIKGNKFELIDRLKISDMEKRREMGIVEIYARTLDNLHKTIFIKKDNYLEDLKKEVVAVYGYGNSFDLKKIILYWRTYDEPIDGDYIINDYNKKKVWRKINKNEPIGNIYNLNGLPLLIIKI